MAHHVPVPPKVGEIAQALLTSDEPVVSVAKAARLYVATMTGWPPTKAAEYIERVLPTIVRAVDERILASHVRGSAPLAFEWDSGRRETATLVHKRLVERQDELLFNADAALIGPLISQLSDTGFERLCSVLLIAYGATSDQTHVTRVSHDGGLDFYALVASKESPRGVHRLTHRPYRVAGQAKRWNDAALGPDTMEAFGMRLLDWRAGALPTVIELPKWFRDATELPILGIMATTGSMTSGAKRAATKRMIVTLELDQIAYDLVSSSLRQRWVAAQSNNLDPDRFLKDFR